MGWDRTCFSLRQGRHTGVAAGAWILATLPTKIMIRVNDIPQSQMIHLRDYNLYSPYSTAHKPNTRVVS